MNMVVFVRKNLFFFLFGTSVDLKPRVNYSSREFDYHNYSIKI